MRVPYIPPSLRERKLMGKLPDSKPGLERSNHSAPAITCGACGKELSVLTNTEPCPSSPYWHGCHDKVVVFKVRPLEGSDNVLWWSHRAEFYDGVDRCGVCCE